MRQYTTRKQLHFTASCTIICHVLDVLYHFSYFFFMKLSKYKSHYQRLFHIMNPKLSHFHTNTLYWWSLRYTCFQPIQLPKCEKHITNVQNMGHETFGIATFYSEASLIWGNHYFVVLSFTPAVKIIWVINLMDLTATAINGSEKNNLLSKFQTRNLF